MNSRRFDDFDEFAQNYREIHNKNISISGEDSDYFTKFKLITISSSYKKVYEKIKILDFGCGDGNLERFIYDFFTNCKYYGIDVSKASIEKANMLKKRNSKFELFDGENIPFQDNYFDIIIVANVFHHIDFKFHNKILKEIYRVLKPSGHFYIFEHNPFNPITRYIVKTCAFDAEAKLLYPFYTKKVLEEFNYDSIQTNYILFFPRTKFFKFFIQTEKLLKKIPIGAQYYTLSIK
jgi:SAM-dependent methyltransferase